MKYLPDLKIIQRIIYIFLFLLPAHARGQENNIPMGQWRIHPSYQNAQMLDKSGSKIYCSTSNGLFTYNTTTREIETFTKTGKLSGAAITAFAYKDKDDVLIVGYEDGNIDLIKGNKGINFTDLKKASFTKNKTIHHISFYKNLAFLSCDFGMITINTEKQEIKSTIKYLGENGNTAPVYQSTVNTKTDSIFIATSQGIKAASLAPALNLQDYTNWLHFNMEDSLPQTKASTVEVFKNQTYCAINDTVYVLKGHWQKIKEISGDKIRNLKSSGGRLLVSHQNKILAFQDTSTTDTITHSKISHPMSAFTGPSGNLWIADSTNGLLTNQNNNFKAIIPNGPYSQHIEKLYYFNNQIAGIPGGYKNNVQPLNQTGALYLFKDGRWQNFHPDITSGMPSMEDFTDMVYSPREKKLFIASLREGILAFDPENASFKKYDTTTANYPIPHDYKITDLAIDKEGTIWITTLNSSDNTRIFTRNRSNEWQEISINYRNTKYPAKLVIDGYGTKWVRLIPGGQKGLFVFNEETGQSRHIKQIVNSKNDLAHVRSITKDLEGNIWLGTDFGAAIYYNTNLVFDDPQYDAVRPFFENRPLLRSIRIDVVRADPSNRKWLGTETGLWLFSESGTNKLAQFTTTNSPLLNNVVNDVDIHPNTGEIFFAMSSGIASYRSNVSKGKEDFSDINVFPNPVRPDFDGVVSIQGTPHNSTVKITDASGNLVFETKAEGGTATWNLKNLNGQKAAPGIYPVFIGNNKSEEGLVTKIAILKEN